MATSHGRGVAGKRGIGSGKASEKTSTGKAATSVMPKSKGDGLGGNTKKVSVPKGKMPKTTKGGGKY